MNCPVCNEPKKEKNKYCSYACRNIVINSKKDYNQIAAKLKTNFAAGRIERVVKCELCENTWTQQSNSVGKYPPNRFCSRVCANTKNHSELTKEKITKSTNAYIQQHPSLKLRSEIKKNCAVCHTEFNGINQTCSKTCGGVLAARVRFGVLLVDKPNTAYRALSKFRFALNTYPSYFDFKLIEQYGWYQPKNRGNNLAGVSRDHIMSVVWAAKNDVNPYLISHPANCVLMQHGQNSSKGCKQSINVDQLLQKINEFEKIHDKYYKEDFKYQTSWIEILKHIRT